MFELKTTCNFRSILETKNLKINSISCMEQPICKVGHIRGDYDGCRWWCQYFACHEHLKTARVKAEIDRVGAYLIEDLLKDGLSAVCELCKAHPEAKIGENEYKFFMNGSECNYLIKLITRSKDYNIYVHIFACSAINT